jgi:hypothetical protein
VSSEALKRANGVLDRTYVTRAACEAVANDVLALLAEVARLEQERRDLKRWNTRVVEQLAVAREREQRLREAVIAWDNSLSSYCDGPERDAVRAALVDDPAAATLAEPGSAKPPLASGSPPDGLAVPPGSASAAAAADEPGETP